MVTRLRWHAGVFVRPAFAQISCERAAGTNQPNEPGEVHGARLYSGARRRAPHTRKEASSHQKVGAPSHPSAARALRELRTLPMDSRLRHVERTRPDGGQGAHHRPEARGSGLGSQKQPLLAAARPRRSVGSWKGSTFRKPWSDCEEQRVTAVNDYIFTFVAILLHSGCTCTPKK